MDVRDALQQISEIRQHMAHSQVFRGYHSFTVGCVGTLAIVAALAQPLVVPSPADDLLVYVTLWVGVAAVALLWVALQLLRWTRNSRSPLTHDASRLAAERFLPCVGVGALMTLAIVRGAPEVGWMLPGLWSLIFSLGVFASLRQLPGPAVWVAAHFAVCGFANLLWGNGTQSLAPWQMALPFGGGLLLSAAILHRTLEKPDDR